MDYLLIDAKNINEAKNLIEKNHKAKKIFVAAKDDEFNRKILENKKVSALIFRDFNDRKDKIKQRNSGINEVLCKLAKDNNIKIGIDLEQLVGKSDIEKAVDISKVIQIVKLCSKYKVDLFIFNQKFDNYDLQGFLLSLGMPTHMLA